MKLISTSQELDLISGGAFFAGLQNMIFSTVGAGIGGTIGKSMVPVTYRAFGGLIGAALGGVAGYAVSSITQSFEKFAYSNIDSCFNKKS